MKRIMNYKDFKAMVLQEFKTFMPNEYKDVELHCRKVNKVNVVKESIHLDRKDTNVSPTIYLNDMYEKYSICESFEQTMKYFADMLLNAMDEDISDNIKKNIYDFNVNKVIFQLINGNQNEDFLKNIPHRQYLDLVIIYRILVAEDDKGIASAIVTNELMNSFGYAESELFEMAFKNTRNTMDVRIMDITDVIMQEMTGQMIEDINYMDVSMLEQEKMWVVTNKKGINGASIMLYEDVISEIAEKMQSDLYILPSSIHELIVISANQGLSVQELNDMVYSINMDTVSREEVLSNNVYFFDKAKKKVSIA